MSNHESGHEKRSKSIKLRLRDLFHRPIARAIGMIGVAFFLIVSGVFGQFGADIYSYVTAFWKDDPDWKIPISLGVDHCHSGSLWEMFEDYEPAINWNGGAERLVICASANVEGAKEEFPLLLEKKFPECLAVSEASGRFTITTDLDSAAICRVPYRYEEDDIKPTSLPDGLFVCMPGHEREESQVSYRQDGVDVPVCKEEDLREYKFL